VGVEIRVFISGVPDLHMEHGAWGMEMGQSPRAVERFGAGFVILSIMIQMHRSFARTEHVFCSDNTVAPLDNDHHKHVQCFNAMNHLLFLSLLPALLGNRTAAAAQCLRNALIGPTLSLHRCQRLFVSRKPRLARTDALTRASRTDGAAWVRIQ